MRTLLALVGLLVASAAPALAKSIHIERMDVELTVHANGAVVAQETLRVRFEGSWNGIFRDLPEAFGDASGFGEISLIDVTDADGAPLEAKVEISGKDLRWRIRVPGASDATRVVRLRYRVEGVVPPKGDRVLYWNVVGTRWSMPLRKVRLRVNAPADWTFDSIRGTTGSEGSQRGNARLTKSEPGTFEMETTRELAAGEGFTVQARLRDGKTRPGGLLKPATAAKFAWLLWVLPLIPLLL